MRRFVVLSSILLCIVCVPGLTDALTITFDEFGTATTDFGQTTALRDEYAQNPYNYGVHFSGPDVKDGGAIILITAPSFPNGPCNGSGCSGNNALAFNTLGSFALENGGGKPVWPETISFDDLWKTVSIWVAPQDNSQGSTISLLAYDEQGNPADTDASIFADWSLLSVSSDRGIKTVELLRSDGVSFAADDLQLTGQMPVPEPGTMLLLGLGIIGIGVLRRRK